ncbi:MAG: hypothetical protein PS018_21835 [bacterium]|nr:hypothetical protein [bacterium]
MTTEPDSVLTGAAYELANGGYVPMPIERTEDHGEAIGSDSVSLREAAAQRGDAADELIVRGYTGPSGEPAAANEAITLSRASHDYAAVTAAERLIAANATAKDLAAEVDALRAEALASNPDAAELYGFDRPPAGEAAERASGVHDRDSGSPGGEDPAASSLDVELEKALQHPQVRHAIEQQLGEAERMRQAYLDGIAAATQIAQVSFLSQFPELAAVAPENLPDALEQLSQQDPAKFERVRAMVAASEQLLERQRAESARQIELNRQGFENYARSEDARFETMMKGETRETQAAVSAEIMASARASGIEPVELNHLFRTEPLMRNAAFQRMMYDAGKYRLMMKARNEAVAKPLPPVIRPGMSRTPAERQQVDLRALNTRLSSTGDIKDAVALYHARKSGRR